MNGILEYFLVFWSGVLVSFTPCTYPLLPIVASLIAGANVKGTKLMGFILSSVFVLGMSITYCALAVFAGLTGKVFGQIQNNPFVYLAISGILVVFALAMFDVIHIPSVGVKVAGPKKPRSLWAILVFGLISGLAVGPCTAPVLGGLLVYVGSKQNIFHAASLMFVFSYGVGASLILIGTFSGLLSLLPKAGAWMVEIKKTCGIILLIVAVYFLLRAVFLFINV